MTTGAIYARISKRDDKYPKVEEQIADCLALAAGLGISVADDAIYAEEPGTSATKGKRAGFEELVQSTAAGKFDVLLAKEQSRFERDPADYLLLKTVSANTGTTWQTISEGRIEPERDEFVSLMRSGMNAEESKRNRRRVLSRNDRTIAEGRPLVTRRPFGYEDDGVTVREPEAELVRYAAQQILKDASLGSILKTFKASGITPVVSRRELKLAADERREPKTREWTTSAIVDVVRRPRNVGDIVHRGQVVGEGITPILKRDVWEACESILSDPARAVARSRALRWMLSGVAICGTCGARMRPSTVNGYPVYRCVEPKLGTRHPMILCRILDGMVEQKVASHFLTADRTAEPEAASAVEVQRKLAEVREKKERAAEGALRKGFGGVFAKLEAELNAEEESLRAQLDSIARSNAAVLLELESRRVLWSKVGGQISFDDAGKAHDEILERFRGFPVEERRAIVRSLFSIVVNLGTGTGRVSIEPLEAEEELLSEEVFLQ
jgi:DNA invertase Pin-like site-specific DNA recombinase